jgi:uncharacterized protein
MPQQKIKPVELRLSATDEATRSVTFTASTSEPVPSRAMVQVEGADRWEERDFSDAIVEWDLERFQTNPVILWGHEAFELPIGTAEELTFDGKELVVRIKFASEKANPKGEQIWQAVREGLVRAVSVGFDGDILTSEERDGVTHRTLKGTLSEISVVSVPADKDALIRQQRAHLSADGSVTESEETDEDRKRKLSEAAKALSAARKPKAKLDADDLMRLDASSRLDSSKIVRTQVGGIRVPARLARAGVFTYRNPDGSIRREYKPREVLSAPETIESFRDAPVIDFFDHTELMSTEDYRRKAVGHVTNVRMDGDYLVGELVINDASTIERIDRGERADVSAGYRTKDDRTPGLWSGQAYDLVQRSIFGNHIALCPPNRGRSGPDVGLRLDSTGAWCAMETESMTTKIKLDGVDYEFGSEAHLAKLGELHTRELAAKDQEIAALKTANDEARAKLDAKDEEEKQSKAKQEKDEADRKKREEEAEEERKKRWKERSKRAIRAARIMEEDEDEKLDGLLDLSDRELMLKAIKHVDSKFDKDDETDDYLRARFDSLEEPSARLDGIDAVANAVRSAAKSGGVDPIAQARQAMVERNRNAWKQGA